MHGARNIPRLALQVKTIVCMRYVTLHTTQKMSKGDSALSYTSFRDRSGDELSIDAQSHFTGVRSEHHEAAPHGTGPLLTGSEPDSFSLITCALCHRIVQYINIMAVDT